MKKALLAVAFAGLASQALAGGENYAPSPGGPTMIVITATLLGTSSTVNIDGDYASSFVSFY